MDSRTELLTALHRCPTIAILRGIRPDEVATAGSILVEAGFTIIEVPLNSPDPFASIEALHTMFGHQVLIGAGTVLTPEEVARLASTGARLAIAPNVSPPVIKAARERSLISVPGYATISEAFLAIDAGAIGLKLFPAESAQPSIVKAHRAVLPDIPVIPVGGITPDNLGDWLEVSDGVGVGSSLYSPGMSPATLAARANAFRTALRKP